MKVRSGFVSNSSSSSFVLFGYYISLQEIFDKDKKEIWCIGEEVGEGIDVFKVDETFKNNIKDYINDYNFSPYLGFFEALFTKSPDDHNEYITKQEAQVLLDATICKNPVEIISVDRSHWSYYEDDGFDAFLKRYGSKK